jgi:hypothetical protein
VLLIGGDRDAEEALQTLLQRKCDDAKRALQIDVVSEQAALRLYAGSVATALPFPAHCAEEVHGEPRYHAMVVTLDRVLGSLPLVAAMRAAQRDVQRWDGVTTFTKITQG